jgi:hypothetical protein
METDIFQSLLNKDLIDCYLGIGSGIVFVPILFGVLFGCLLLLCSVLPKSGCHASTVGMTVSLCFLVSKTDQCF